MKLIICVLLSALSVSVSAASNFESLPNATVLNMRLPDGSAAAAALKKTQAYALFADPKRWQAVTALIKKNAGSEFDDFMEALAVFNLKPEDFPKLFAGETGIAVALHAPAEGKNEPLVTGVLYLNPEADLADRLMQAIDQVIVINQNEEGAPKIARNDYDVGAHTIIELTSENEEASFFINRNGNAITVFVGMEHGLDATKQFIVEHLDARAGDGNAEGFAQTVLNTPGLADVIPAGQSLFELTTNPQVLIDLIPENEIATPAMGGAEVRQALGLHCFKPCILVSTMENNVLHSAGFMGCSSPLEGVARIFEFPELEAGPAAWVPKDIVSYSHLGFNLQHTYRVVTETIAGIMGPAGAAKIQEVNNAPMLFLGTDLETFLGNFGDKIVGIDYGKKPPEGAAANPMMGSFADRVAIVWDMNDTTALKQALPLLQQQAAMFGGMAAEEQGASGVRFNMSMMQPGLEGGFFITDDKMILALGVGVTELILSSVQNPAPLAETLAASQMLKDANAILPPKKGFIYSVQDTNAAMVAEFNSTNKELKRLGQLEPEVGSVLTTLMPTGEEIDGVMGVGSQQAYRDADGLYLKGAVVLELATDAAPSEEEAP